MKLLVGSVAALAMLGSVSAAYATDTAGTIKSLDAGKRMITLDSGTTYTFPQGMKLSGFKVGEKVKLIYTYDHGKFDASSIKPVAHS